jgi:hypothetical protein
MRFFFSERPQMFSLLLVLLVGPWAVRLATTGQWRAWPWAIAHLWCNLHGWWVLGPALGLAAGLLAAQSRFSRRSLVTLGKAAVTGVLAVLARWRRPSALR